MSFKKHNRKLGLMLSFLLLISTILTVLVIPLPIAKAAPAYSWATFTVAASGDDVELLADNGWSNYTTDGDNLWVHSNEYTTYAWLRFEGLSAITDAGGVIDQIILGMYSGADEGADYEESPYGGYVSVSCPLYSWDWELTEENILSKSMGPVASFDGDNLSPSGAWYNKTISNNDPRDWYSWGSTFNDVFICYVAGFMQYSPDWTYYRSFTSFDEGHPAKLYVKYHIGEGYEEVLSEFGVDYATYVQNWYNYNIWQIPGAAGALGYPLEPMEYLYLFNGVDPHEVRYDNVTTIPIVYNYVADGTSISSPLGIARCLIRLDNGTLYAGYGRTPVADMQVYVKKSVDEGLNWIDETLISTLAGMSTAYNGELNLAVDSSDKIHAIWHGRVTGTYPDTQIWYSKFDGDSWSTPLRISTGTDMEDYPQSYTSLAVDSYNRLHVLWQGKASGYAITQIWYSKFDGESWSTPLRISTGIGGMSTKAQQQPTIAIDSLNNLHVLWGGCADGYPEWDYQIWYSNFTGDSWSTPLRISTGTDMEDAPQRENSITIDYDDNLHAIWDGDALGYSGYKQIWYSKFDGESWSTPLRISTGTNQAGSINSMPSIASDSDDYIHILWVDARPASDLKIWYKFYNGTWQDPYYLHTGENYNPNIRWSRYPVRTEAADDEYVATAPNGTVITPEPFDTPEEVLDFVKYWDSIYGPACSFNGATLYEADGVTVKTDGWLFMGEVYVVKAEIRNFTTFYLELDDGKNKVLFNYVNATKSLNVEASEFVAGLVQGTVTTLNLADEVYELSWKFILNKNILDIPIGQNMTYFGVNTPQGSHLSGTAITGLMIYNLGGHVTYDFQGDAGRRIGGDALEVHHTNSTGNGAYVDVMFRRMQHIHLAFSLDVEDNDCFDVDENSGIVQFGFKYWDGADWDDLYYAEMSIVNGAVDPVSGDGKAFIIPYVSWNSRQSDGNMTIVKSDTLSGYPECADDVNSQITYSKFYLDLWFNTMNSSTTVGGRLSTKYFGMDESTSWFFWSNWKPVMVNQTESMFYDDLRDSDGDILQISDIDLVKFYIRVLKTGEGSGSCDSHTWGIFDPEFSKTLAADRMQAINTPEGIDTLVLDMPSTGFLQPLAKAIQGIGNMIWAGALNFVKILIASMDTIFVWIGFPAGTFSQISNWVLTIPDFMIALIGYFGDILGNMITQVTRLFNVIAIGVPQLIYGTGVLVSTITSYLNQIISLFTGGWSGVSDFWTGLNLAQWIELFCIAVLPFMWIQRLEGSRDAFKTAREDVGFVFRLLFVLIDLGSWLIQTIGTILQAIRNILPI